VWYVFREIPFLADVFPSCTVEADDSTLCVCPESVFVVLNDGGREGRYTVGFAVALDVAVPQDTDLVLTSIDDPQTAIGERQQAAQWAIRKLISRSRYIPFKVNPIESKEPFISGYPQKTICGLCQILRPCGISFLLAPGPVSKLVDVAIRTERKGSRDERQKEGADRKSMDDPHSSPFGQSATVPSTIFARAAPAPSDNGQMTFATHVARLELYQLTSKCEVI
jgi:hypothetical protein